MNTTPYTVRQARPEEISQVLDTLTEAFLNDPYMYKVLGEKPQEDKLRARFEVQLEGTYMPRGCVDVAVDLDGKILGTALWLSPENQQTDVKQELRDNAKFMRILGPRTVRSLSTGICTRLRYGRQLRVLELERSSCATRLTVLTVPPHIWRHPPRAVPLCTSVLGSFLWAPSPRETPIWACCTP